MNYAHLFEAAMLVCFGFSWPLNVYKAYRARTAKGTSLPFILLIITGYVAGIAAKFINRQFNYVLAVYFLNLAIVSLNVFVYIRNKNLDRKNASANSLKVQVPVEGKKEKRTGYSNSFDEIADEQYGVAAEKNPVVLLGCGIDCYIPVKKLGEEFGFNFDVSNKSEKKLKLSNAIEYFAMNVKNMYPEGIIFHLGENDMASFVSDPVGFERMYRGLIDMVRGVNEKCRIGLVSVNNPAGDSVIGKMNEHIRNIAEKEDAVFINLENAKLWNPEATKESWDFACSMGLNVRKPLRNVAEIFYSYAYNNMMLEEKEEKAN